MKRKIDIEGLSLAYIEVNPQLHNTIFFIHGGSGSSKAWAHQLNNPSFSSFRLIAFDLPAHGESSASPTPEQHYGVADLGSIIGKAIRTLAAGQNNLLAGFSLGANILCEALPFCTPTGIILIAPSILGENYTLSSIKFPEADTSALFVDYAPEDSIQAFYQQSLFNKSASILQDLIADYNAVQAPFRSTMFHQSTLGGRISDEIALLRDTGLPTLVIFGKDESIIYPDYLASADLNIWRNEIYKLPEAGHFVHVEQHGSVNRLVKEYAKEQFTDTHA